MTESGRIGVLGGTFDPIHFGHLDAADAARRALALDRIHLVPSHDPPHRAESPVCSGFHRFALASLAIDGLEPYTVSDLELARTGPSYTMDSLRALRAGGWAPSQLFFILGADAFAEIATWHEYPGVLDEAHFVVIARPGTTIEAAAARTPVLGPRMRRVEDGDPRGAATRIWLVEAQTRAISSTMIRTRLAARQPIDDLVPASVARHIAKHQLYGAVGSLHGRKQDE
jgi:nicotinate-nucleotide adenylyltransferase